MNACICREGGVGGGGSISTSCLQKFKPRTSAHPACGKHRLNMAAIRIRFNWKPVTSSDEKNWFAIHLPFKKSASSNCILRSLSFKTNYHWQARAHVSEYELLNKLETETSKNVQWRVDSLSELQSDKIGCLQFPWCMESKPFDQPAASNC